MSKRAEQKALEAYPIHSVLIQPARRGGYYADNLLREGFVKGYEQAEKDLALTWKDIAKIDDMLREVGNCIATSDLPTRGREEYYTEVLNRYNELKK